MKIALGVIFLGIVLGMLLGPMSIRADNGEHYIRLALFLIIGSGLLFFGLFPRQEDQPRPDQKAKHS
jgi:hypothetical protein